MCSSGRHLMLIDCKYALFVTENRVHLFHEFCKRPRFKEIWVRRRVIWAIAEEAFLYRMSMEIHIKLESLLISILQLNWKLIKIENFRVNISDIRGRITHIFELPIQIFSWVRSSEVPCNDSIRVQHRNYVKNKQVSEIIGFISVSQKLSNKSFENVRSIWLPWMNTACY